MSTRDWRTKGARIERLLDAMRRTYGAAAIRPFGDTTDPNDTGFTIAGVDATFSVIVEEPVSQDRYNIQIESHHPPEYLKMAIVSLAEFEALVDQIARSPRRDWPH